ncbi:MAG: preprotein translocase subunit SecE [Deltaproteobacteria bacterium]
MTEHKKIVFSCFLIFAVIAFFILSKLFTGVAGYFDLFAYGEIVENIFRLLPVVLTIALFFGFYRHEKSNAYVTEVVAELKKVTWPAQKEVSAATVAVIIAVLISATVLFIVDSLWSFVIQKVLSYGS